MKLVLDGIEVEALPGESLFNLARRHGKAIPHLCHKDGYRPDGNCRACVVEIEGERTLAASCIRPAVPGLRVNTGGERVEKARALVFELLGASRPVPPDRSHPAIAVRLEACVACGLCVRACREVQGNDVIGMSGRGAATVISFDLGTALGDSSCVGCGECVQACPTGALLPVDTARPERHVDSLCPFCGVGCQIAYGVAGDAIVVAEGRDGPANHRRLCVKGRFGFDYSRHPQRLTVPLIRKEGAPKVVWSADAPPALDGASEIHNHFRPATWEEALDRAAGGFKRHPSALAGFGSAKGSNEEAYLFQKLVRTGFGSNNVDHCTRLCHAASVAALLEGIGSGAVTAPVSECRNAEVIVVIGANPTVNHPVAASFIKNAVGAGAKLVLLDPRGQALERLAEHSLRFTPGTDVALLNALLNVIITERLYDAAFVADRTTGFDDLARHIAAYTPEAMAPLCGVAAESLRAVARLYAGARTAMIFWGMGISQHSHGTDNARCLVALALLCGQVGRPGTGLHPLRGQNNVQGASDAGLIPMMLPDYQRVVDPAVRARFEAEWGGTLPAEPGLTVVEILDAAAAGGISAMLIMGENPAMSDPDLAHARAALAALDHLVVQDIFLTETAMLADVVLPASSFFEKTGSFSNTDRRIQMGRRVLSPPGEARGDLWIIQQLARRLGLAWNYDGPEAVFDEMCRVMPSLTGITWRRLEDEDCITYPEGRAVLFGDRFPTADGRGRLVPSSGLVPAESPDAEFPVILTTGRILEHWHTGVMTRRSRVLDAIEPTAAVHLAPADMTDLGITEGETVRLTSRRGRLEVAARADATLPAGLAFMPFCWAEAAANLLTNPILDPVAKIPEFKVSAVRVEKT
jgi:formate dehydrogenase major subunit